MGYFMWYFPLILFKKGTNVCTHPEIHSIKMFTGKQEKSRLITISRFTMHTLGRFYLLSKKLLPSLV